MAFNRDNRSGGRQSGGGRDFGRRSFGGDRGGSYGSGDREMFKATCSNCGRECEVPFKPTGSKPVYCNDCFRTMGRNDSGQGRSDDRGPRRSFDRPSDRPAERSAPQSQYKEQFDALNAKLDKILRLLNPEVPSVEMPVTENAEPVVKKVRAKKKAVVEAEVPVEEAPIE